MDRDIEISQFRDYLKFKNLRMTPQRELILTEFLEMKGHFTIEDLFSNVIKKSSTLGIATLSRNMILMVEAGLAIEHKFNNGKTTFEHRYGTRHHDHLICVSCNKIEEFESPMIEKLQNETANEHKFFLQSHKMELYGICRTCSNP